MAEKLTNSIEEAQQAIEKGYKVEYGWWDNYVPKSSGRLIAYLGEKDVTNNFGEVVNNFPFFQVEDGSEFRFYGNGNFIIEIPEIEKPEPIETPTETPIIIEKNSPVETPPTINSQQIADELFAKGVIIEQPFTRGGMFSTDILNLTPGLYVVSDGTEKEMFFVYTRGKEKLASRVTANVNGGLYSHWYGETWCKYDPFRLMTKRSAIVKRCDDGLWQQVVADYEADITETAEHWANS